MLAWARGIAGALVGAGPWGLHTGLSQGLLAAMIADAIVTSEARALTSSKRRTSRGGGVSTKSLELQAASRVIVAKGKSVREFKGGAASKDGVDAMLGPTGNLRAPTIKVGTTVLVGFDDEVFTAVLG